MKLQKQKLRQHKTHKCLQLLFSQFVLRALHEKLDMHLYRSTTRRSQYAPIIFKETNVEIRRELIRKVGLEQVFEQMPHKLLDTQDNYELYSIDLSEEVKDARYLKMTNPSIQVFHIEGVAPEIATVKDALKWRNQNMFENADVLT